MNDMLGALNKQDPLQKVIYVTPNLLLFKICNLKDAETDAETNAKTYWCMLDTNGHIQPLPDIFREKKIISVRNFCLRDGSIWLML